MDANVVFLSAILVAILFVIVLARMRGPQVYQVIYEEVSKGQTVAKCPNCGHPLGENVDIRTTMGGVFKSRTNIQYTVKGGHEICPQCHVRVKR